jgi:hypothetical protein
MCTSSNNYAKISPMIIPVLDPVLPNISKGISEISCGHDDELLPFDLDRVKVSDTQCVMRIVGQGVSWYSLSEAASRKGKAGLSLRALYSITEAIEAKEFRRRFGTEILFAIDTILARKYILGVRVADESYTWALTDPGLLQVSGNTPFIHWL